MTNKVELVTQTLTAPGTGPALSIPYQGSGLPPEVAVTGNFGGTSAQVEWSLDGTTFFAIGSALTAAGVVQINRLARFIRVVLTGGTGINVRVTLAY